MRVSLLSRITPCYMSLVVYVFHIYCHMNIINYHPKQPLVFSLGIVHCIKDTFVMILTEEKLGYLEMSYFWNISNIISLLTNPQRYLQVFPLLLISKDQSKLKMMIFRASSSIWSKKKDKLASDRPLSSLE